MVYFNRMGRICLVVGIIAGLLAWGALTLILVNDHRVSGMSSLAGIAVASAVDLLYRVIKHREKGVVRLVHCDCGGTYLAIPAGKGDRRAY